MQTLILTLQENIFDVHHLVEFPMTVDNMTVANVSHSASMTHSCMDHSTINLVSRGQTLSGIAQAHRERHGCFGAAT